MNHPTNDAKGAALKAARIQAHLNKGYSFEGRDTTLGEIIAIRVARGWTPKIETETKGREVFDRVQYRKEWQEKTTEFFCITDGTHLQRLSKIGYDFAVSIGPKVTA